MAMTQTLAPYMEKLRHNGVSWGLNQAWRRLSSSIFGYADKTLVIYAVDLATMPPLEARLENVRYAWLEAADLPRILSLDYAELPRETAESYLERDARCYGALLDDRLIAYIWLHDDHFHFSYFDYTLTVGAGELYDGPDFVHPDFRGQRLHEALLSHAARELLAEGYTRAFGSALKDNLSSRRGIDRAGPRPEHTLRVVKFRNRTVLRRIEGV